MFIINENEREYRFGESGPKYLMKGPRMNFALVRFRPGEDFQAHYHNIMEEDFFILEGKVDIVVDGADAVAAGNDVVMPGGPPVIAQVLKGYEEGRVNREQLEAAAAHLLYFVMHSAQMKG